MEYGERVYCCENGHSFDISREGYVNLLLANQQHSSSPGDDRIMVNARTRFLSGGWYAPLQNELCNLAEYYLPGNGVLMDSGCGEGYYTEALETIAACRNGVTVGIDISKSAVRRAAKRCINAEIAVASVYHMPLADRSVNLLYDCFAPLAKDEFHRVLKPGGTFLYVVPGRKHLWEMKTILYDNPYENELRSEEYSGFRLVEEVPLEFLCNLKQQQDIADLFQMTPYAWKTPEEGIARLQRYTHMDITAEFRILVFKRE